MKKDKNIFRKNPANPFVISFTSYINSNSVAMQWRYFLWVLVICMTAKSPLRQDVNYGSTLF